MRDDMSRVLLETTLSTSRGRDFGVLRHARKLLGEPEELPSRESMRFRPSRTRYDKWRGCGRRAPLIRFLRSRTGRPWDLVRGEIAAAVPKGTNAARIVEEWIRGLVIERTFYDAEGILCHVERMRPTPVPRTHRRFHVDPRGILRDSARLPKRTGRLVAYELPVVCIDGRSYIELLVGGNLAWFEIRFDLESTGGDSDSTIRLLPPDPPGKRTVHALPLERVCWKRQLSRREVKRLGLGPDARRRI